jgi:hypothetical protein
MKTSLRKVLSRLGVKKSASGKSAVAKGRQFAKVGPSGNAVNARGAGAQAKAKTSPRGAKTVFASASPNSPRKSSAKRAMVESTVTSAHAGPPTRTGETIFGQRALRFHSLTLNAANLEQLEHPQSIQGGFKIRVARQSGSRRNAGTLVDERYAGRGYTTKPQAEHDPQLATFIAFDEGALVGTVSVRLDSRRGLSADELYRSEIDAMRRSGKMVCEFTRLAVDRTVASKPVLAGLFHTAYLYAAVIRGCTHAVIEVNPRHVTFYRKALDFELIGAQRMNLRVHAPAVLLCVPFAAIASGLAKFAGRPGAAGAGRLLYPYGFQPGGEESGVLNRLRQLVQGAPA